MNKANSFPKVKQNASLGTSKQYNAIVNYIISRKFGVKAGCLTDYEKLVKYFSARLWEIDPHYHKLKTRGMPFFESVEKNVLGFNKPASHGHAPKRLSSESLSLKVQNLYQCTDRNYMDSSHMKPWRFCRKKHFYLHIGWNCLVGTLRENARITLKYRCIRTDRCKQIYSGQ